MPQRIRLGTVTNGTLDSTDATIEIDGDDLYITVENGDVRTDGTVAFEDATADPSANGEIQRNGADLKAYSGGAVRNLTSPTFESVTAGDGTIGGDPILGGPSSSSSSGLSFGSWTELNANQPVLLELRIFVETDGTTRGNVQIDVDESGGTSSDYVFVVRADADIGSGVTIHESLLLYLPAGAQIRLQNTDDPNGVNSIATDRVFVMSS